MRARNFTTVLILFLVALLGFAIVQVINILTSDPLPISAEKQLQQLDPSLNQSVLDDLKGN